MNEISIKAMGKVNLGLDVLCRRPDGYHEVRMIMQSVDLGDTLKIAKTEEEGISIRTNRKDLPVDEQNLVYKAIRLMQEEFDLSGGVRVRLDKQIPMAAGMGGGSADAAAALVGMNRLFDLKLTEEKLKELGLKLGADVPFCILGGTALAEGIGEVLTPLPKAPSCYVLIAKPDLSVSTKEVYESLHAEGIVSHPDIDGMIQAIWKKNLNGVTERMENVLEGVTVKKHPVIEQLKDKMRQEGAMEAMMSGSGPTVFGIFEDAVHAGEAYKQIAASGLSVQTCVTRFADAGQVVLSEG
ncbi:MAG: 4-(cytidine 5'-diphospho)-2-C-methyl-D-erythritol kinase [Clostridiales bacterium]|nr:4-(cytidine 5'-diphospho)-2-C-methyl-D-erythritol kinase [Clostridiales bacterium]